MDRLRVFDGFPKRKLDAAKALIETLTPTQRASAEAVLMSMGTVYMKAAKQSAPQAGIFHWGKLDLGWV